LRPARQGVPFRSAKTVDHFKLYNDLHGHQQGDECLRAVASVVGKNALRPADLSARYGGEEFAIIMPETDEAGAREVAERVQDLLAGFQLTHGAPAVDRLVTLSIGIATQIPCSDLGPDWLLRQADQALYAAKHTGRNRVVSADETLSVFARAPIEGDHRPRTRSRKSLGKRGR
jgi:diguanylate cyclase (GGDEF)-like protein